MKKTLHISLATLVLAFLTAPAWAQKGASAHANAHASAGLSAAATHSKKSSHSSASSGRSNKGGTVRGIERAEEVQALNTRADAKRGFTVAPGVEKAEGETSTTALPKSSTHGKSSLHSKSAAKTHQGTNGDMDESKDK